jgi:UDP-N-acetyl-D-glucosamine dehydrogenase
VPGAVNGSGLAPCFIELAGEVNRAMPGWVVDRLAEALDRHVAKALNGSRVLVLGIAYKKNVDDTRESPGLAIIERLQARRVAVAFHDPHCPEIPRTHAHAHLAGMRSTPLDAALLAAQDAALIVTDHDAVDYQALLDHCPLVVDTRNATQGLRPGWARVVRA